MKQQQMRSRFFLYRQVNILIVLRKLLVLAPKIPSVLARVECATTLVCERTLLPGSECVDGFCTNPFVNRGCLAQMKDGWTKTRVCNSEDPPDAAEKGYCHVSDSRFDYTEIRISPQNWMSGSVGAWILQILFSEMLDVPTTVETSVEDLNSNFYDVTSRLDFGLSLDFKALETSKLLGGDCTAIEQEPGNYIPCSHVIPENWLGLSPQKGLEDVYGYDPSTETLDPPIQLGAIAQESWYIPRFTAERDPSLLSFLGLQGEENRQKLADRFLRPTTWGDYCAIVSTDNCAMGDSIAARAPIHDSGEIGSYFVEGLYKGHFRRTDENDCILNPETCTGHIADYPCGWSSNVGPVAYWNHIALSSSGNIPGSRGYEYGELVQIMMAANATKSDLMILWWYPDLDFQRYLGTDAELMKVTLPTVTQECLDNIISARDRCSSDEATRNGDSRGSCDEPPLALQKVIGSIVRTMTNNPTVPEELHSPAYDVLRDFTLTSYQIGEVFDKFFALNIDPDNYDLRAATCSWFVENFDSLKSSIPEGYPRILQNEKDMTREPIYYAAILLSVVSLAAVAFACVAVYLLRNQAALRLAQVEFLSVVLLGLMMVTIGSLLLAIPATNSICIASIWMVNIGYTFEIVPLVVKMGAVFRMMRAAEKMKHLEFTRKSLFSAMLVPTFVMGIYLLVWSIIDPPQKNFEYKLQEGRKTADDESIVERTPYCASEADMCDWIAVAWHFLLLVTATVQAFQARDVLKKLADENQTLAFMIYSHFVFVCCRVATFVFDESFAYSTLAFARSIVFSLDALCAVCIYFIPKILDKSTAGVTGDSNDRNRVTGTKSEQEFNHLARLSHVHHDLGDDEEEDEFEGFEAITDQLRDEPAERQETALANNINRATQTRRPSGGDEQPAVSIAQQTNTVTPRADTGNSSMDEDDEDDHPGYGSSSDEDDHPGYNM